MKTKRAKRAGMPETRAGMPETRAEKPAEGSGSLELGSSSPLSPSSPPLPTTPPGDNLGTAQGPATTPETVYSDAAPRRPHRRVRVAAAPITAHAIERQLEPVTAGASSILDSVGAGALDDEEGGAWRQATAAVLEKYQRMWVLAEVIWLLITTGIVVSHTKEKPWKLRLACLAPVFVVFGLMLVGAAKLAKQEAADAGSGGDLY